MEICKDEELCAGQHSTLENPQILDIILIKALVRKQRFRERKFSKSTIRYTFLKYSKILQKIPT